MISYNFKTETISSKTKILVIENSSLIAAEVENQLREKTNIDLEIIPKFPALLKSMPEIIIYFFYPDQKKINPGLKPLLKFCTDNSLKIFLIIPDSFNYGKSELQELILTHSRINFINYQIISLDHTLEADENASDVISKFYYGHKFKPRIPKVNPTESTPFIKSKKLPKKLNIPVLFFGLIILPYFLLIIQLVFLFMLSRCLYNSYMKSSVSLTKSCAAHAWKLSKIIYPQTVILPGAKSLITYLGYPPDKVVNVLQTFSDSQSAYGSFITEFILSGKNFDHFQFNNILTSTSETLGLLQSSLRDLYLASPAKPDYLLALGQSLVTDRSFVSKLLLLTSDAEKFFPQGKVNYLILIQDHTEIRPTGGFLNGFFILTIESGKVTQIQPFTSSQADSLLAGQVEPPASFQSAFKSNQWFLRDANWDPDFPTSAKRVAWFVEKELSIPINAVVAVNSKFFPKLLEILGDQNISNSKTPVSAENYYEQYFSQKSISSSSTFLLNLSQEIYKSSTRLSADRYAKLVKLIARQLELNNIIISGITFNSSALENTGWNGKLNDPPCVLSVPCIKDMVYQVDSNIGVNSLDYSLKRQFQLDIQFLPKQILTTSFFKYKNEDSGAGTGDTYKNYFRVYLPSIAQISSVLVNQQPLSSEIYSVSFEHGLQVISLPVNVPPKSEAEISISYSQTINATSQFHYQLNLRSQPGINDKSIKVSLNYPPNWTISTRVTPQSPVSPVATAGLLRYNTASDQISRLEFDITPTQ